MLLQAYLYSLAWSPAGRGGRLLHFNSGGFYGNRRTHQFRTSCPLLSNISMSFSHLLPPHHAPRARRMTSAQTTRQFTASLCSHCKQVSFRRLTNVGSPAQEQYRLWRTVSRNLALRLSLRKGSSRECSQSGVSKRKKVRPRV